MVKKYVILNLETNEMFHDSKYKPLIYYSYEEALNICGIYELENVWIAELISNHKE